MWQFKKEKEGNLSQVTTILYQLSSFFLIIISSSVVQVRFLCAPTSDVCLSAKSVLEEKAVKRWLWASNSPRANLPVTDCDFALLSRQRVAEERHSRTVTFRWFFAWMANSRQQSSRRKFRSCFSLSTLFCKSSLVRKNSSSWIISVHLLN